MAALTHLLYLHGFRSSPQSAKARRMSDWVRAERPDLEWWCPQLPPSPAEAMKMVQDVVANWPAARSAVIGSSLGGFYATSLAERLGWRAALLNPAVNPARDLTRYIGENTTWQGDDRFYFRPEFIAELRVLAPVTLSRLNRYFAIIAKGDEVLSWEEMSERYEGCKVHLLEGGDHAISDFEQYLPEVVDFITSG